MDPAGTHTYFGLDLLALLLLFAAGITALFRQPMGRRSRTLFLLWLIGLMVWHCARILPLLINRPLASPDPALSSFLLFFFAALFFRSTFSGWIGQAFNYALTALLSVSLTLFFTNTLPPVLQGIRLATTMLLAGFVITSLGSLLRRPQLFILHQPLFWIATGTLFYLMMELLLEVLIRSGQAPLQAAEKQVLLQFFQLLQYGLFLAAMLVNEKKPDPVSVW